MRNPFIFNAASNLDTETLMNLFIPDHNYSRFIISKRNVFLWGERGCGKTMTLLYNKTILFDEINNSFSNEKPIEYIPVYVSCITPLVFKREFLLLDNEFKAAIISEHYLSLSIALSLVEAILESKPLTSKLNCGELCDSVEYIFNQALPPGKNSLLRIKIFLTKKFIETQQQINQVDSDSFFSDTYTFTSVVLPLINLLNDETPLKNTHFIIMMDDAHDLNEYQKYALNNLVAYRDNSSFSFKISAAKAPEYNLTTSSGGVILPGHDYIDIDIEQPYQNSDSAFGKLANKIISRRLELIGVDTSPEDFFPTNTVMSEELDRYKEEARKIGISKYGAENKKKVNDYVYKYARAIYFRERSSKANRVPYSGLDTIMNLSSGVVRNLLEPCYIMFDDCMSESNEKPIHVIPPAIQKKVILRLSENYWSRLRTGLEHEISDCQREDGRQLLNLFNRLAELFRSRLLDEACSEPRSISFTISAQTDSDVMMRLKRLINLARIAQLIYVRSGSAKDDGAKEDYYVPNKMLWPSRGLDPIGQHARVSIKADVLLKYAENEKADILESINQGDLF